MGRGWRLWRGSSGNSPRSPRESETRVCGDVRGCGKLRCVLGLGIVCVISAAAWVYLVASHGGFWLTSQRLPPVGALGAVPGSKAWPAVVAVVPARNEAESLPTTLP